MRVDVRRAERSRAILEVELPPDEVDRALRRAYTRLVQKVEVPGFRRGKAPRAILERYVGREALIEEARRVAVPEAYARAVEQSGIAPISSPEFEQVTLEEGQPLRFVAQVEVRPEVTLGDYRGIQVPRESATVTDEDVARVLDDLRARHGTLASAGDAPAGRGAFLLLRVEESEQPERFAPGAEMMVEIGGGLLGTEAEEALVGARTGERRTVAARAGEGTAPVTVSVVDHKRKELPTLDDEFAKTVAQAATLDDLKTRVRERLQADAQERARRDHQERLVTALLEQSAVDLPDSMVEHELLHMVNDMAERLRRQGLTLEAALRAQGKELKDLLDDFRPTAERRVKTLLVLDALATREGVAPTEQEIEHEVQKLAGELGRSVDEVRRLLAADDRIGRIRATLRRQKTVEWLTGLAASEGSEAPPA
ncbi:MAG: trigger factor [Armatimonadetes bacterium]|nr:trigger factor [Armatimonadota bacterium]